jgi:hypothetical protein
VVGGLDAENITFLKNIFFRKLILDIALLLKKKYTLFR